MMKVIPKRLRSGSVQKYFNNTLWLFFDRFFNLIVAFAVGVAVTKYLGPEQFGLLSYAKSIAGFLLIVSSLGFESLLHREFLKDGEQGKVMGTAFVLRIGTAVASLLLTWLTLLLTDTDALTLHLIVIFASVAVFESSYVIRSYFQSIVKSRLTAIAALVQTLVLAVFKLLFIYLGFSVIYFAGITLFASVVYAIMLFRNYVTNSGNLGQWSFDGQYAKSLLHDTWPLMIGAIVTFIYMKTDMIIIKILMNNEAVGQYAVIVRMTELWYYVPMLICNSIFPAIFRAKKVSEQLFIQRIEYLHHFLFAVAVLLGIGTWWVGEDIVVLLFGDEYREAGQLLPMYIWTCVFIFLGIAGSQWIIVENLQRLRLVFNVGGAVLNVGLNFLLIPQYGIAGAIYATLIAQGFVGVFGNLLLKETRPLFGIMIRSLVLPEVYVQGWRYVRQKLK